MISQIEIFLGKNTVVEEDLPVIKDSIVTNEKAFNPVSSLLKVKPEPLEESPFDCDFENDICSFEQVRLFQCQFTIKHFKCHIYILWRPNYGDPVQRPYIMYIFDNRGSVHLII